jgi:hypothetical protein
MAGTRVFPRSALKNRIREHPNSWSSPAMTAEASRFIEQALRLHEIHWIPGFAALARTQVLPSPFLGRQVGDENDTVI